MVIKRRILMKWRINIACRIFREEVLGDLLLEKTNRDVMDTFLYDKYFYITGFFFFSRPLTLKILLV